jgi:hypothetical protein
MLPLEAQPGARRLSSRQHLKLLIRVTREVHAHNERIWASFLLAHHSGLDQFGEARPPAPRWAGARPFEVCAAVALQEAARRYLALRRTRRAAIRIQRFFQRSKSRPSLHPFVALLRHQLTLLLALSVCTVACLETAVVLIRPLAVVPLYTVITIPLLVGLSRDVRRAYSPTPSPRAPSFTLLGLLCSSTLHVAVQVARAAWTPAEMRAEVEFGQQFFTLRCIHNGVMVQGIHLAQAGGHPVPCRRRQCRTAYLALLVVVDASAYARVLGEPILGWLARGPLFFCLIAWITHRLTDAAVRHAVAREHAMGDLRLALDAAPATPALGRVPSNMAELVDAKDIARAWTEGPLVRFLLWTILGGVLIFMSCCVLWRLMARDPLQPNPVPYMTVSSPLAACALLLVALASLWPRAAYHASLAFAVLLLSAHAFHVAQKVGEIMPLLAAGRGAGLWGSATHPVSVQPPDAHCAADSETVPATPGGGACPSGLRGADTAGGGIGDTGGGANGSRHAWGPEESLLFTEIFEPTLSFVRGFVTLVLPISPRWRALAVLLVGCKQLAASMVRVLSMEQKRVVVAVLLRDSSMAMLGVAAVRFGGGKGRAGRCRVGSGDAVGGQRLVVWLEGRWCLRVGGGCRGLEGVGVRREEAPSI